MRSNIGAVSASVATNVVRPRDGQPSHREANYEQQRDANYEEQRYADQWVCRLGWCPLRRIVGRIRDTCPHHFCFWRRFEKCLALPVDETGRRECPSVVAVAVHIRV